MRTFNQKAGERTQRIVMKPAGKQGDVNHVGHRKLKRGKKKKKEDEGKR